MPAWITSLFLNYLPQLLYTLGAFVDQGALFKALVAGEVAEPGFLGPLKAVLAAKDAIFLNDKFRATAVEALNWLITRFSTQKLATLAVERGLTVDKPLANPHAADGAHAATDGPAA